MEKPQKVFDYRNLLCPMPVLETSKAIKQVNTGETIAVWTTDPAAKSDFQAWSKRTGHELVGVFDREGYTEFVIKRTK